MQSDATSDAPALPPTAPALPGRAKYRLRFRKGGDLRLVSHHDLMHVFERMFRRAGLPVRATEGFNPRPRMWFALSLALGVAGRNEVLELELTEPLSADDIHDRLRRECPPGMEVVSVRPIDARAAGRARRAFFRLPLPQPVPDLADRVAAFLARPHAWIERTRPHRRRLDLRPYVSELTPAADALDLALWITPYGAARPEEIVDALGLRELLDAGAVLERTDLELYDELTPEQAALPGPPDRFPTEEPAGAEPPTAEPPAASRPTPLIDSPMSFDS